jgi:hypothetical protein
VQRTTTPHGSDRFFSSQTKLTGALQSANCPRSSDYLGKYDTPPVLRKYGLAYLNDECILVLAAVTASPRGSEQRYQRPVSMGAGIGFVATLLTWCVAVRIVDDIGENLSALAVRAATGLLAILVLLVVMNWFFHKLYWTGWISLHNQRKRELLKREKETDGALGVFYGMALLGFTSFYREGCW